jgi:hypothetical protein
LAHISNLTIPLPQDELKKFDGSPVFPMPTPEGSAGDFWTRMVMKEAPNGFHNIPLSTLKHWHKRCCANNQHSVGIPGKLNVLV